jgi:DNA-binding CsgD family transcriptional regulator
MTNAEIAARLGISAHTAKFHVGAVLGKLGARSRADAVARASRLGWIVV